MSDFLQPCGLQHTRLPCLSPTLRAYSSPRPASVIPSNHLILCHPLLQSFPVVGCFPMSRFFTPDGQSIGVSASSSVLPMNIPSGLINRLDLPAVQATLKSLLQHHSSKPSIVRHSSFLYSPAFTSIMTTGKTTALTRWTFVGKVMCLF